MATRVPDHRTLLLVAMAAGKHVYGEWPLGAATEQAHDIADVALSAGGKHAVGLQLRASPTVRKAREILASGALGRVLSVSVSSTTAGFGPDVLPQFAYLEEPAAFANMVTIQGAHTLDLLVALLSDSAVNVASVYKGLHDDISTDLSTVTDFEHAVRLTRLIEDVLAASRDGSRAIGSVWPEG